MTAPHQPPPPKKNRTNLIAILSVVALLVIGGVVAIVVTANRGGESSGPTATAKTASKDAGLAEDRDAAVEDGAAAAETLNTLDAATVEEDLDRWESVSTGSLHDEIAGNRDQYETQLKNAKTRTEATVLSAALAKLDQKEGAARLLVALRIDVTPAGGEAAVKQVRLSLTLTKTPDGWKVANLERK